jgi:phosphoenolpyruvate---glycerone phosphotransferase subunit DhaL
MNGDQLRALLAAALPGLGEHVEELRDLDAALGDGDLGITVLGSVGAALAAIDAMPAGTTPAGVLLALGPVVARANPSTFSALAMGALLAASKAIAGEDDIDGTAWIRAGRAAAGSIATRGKSAVGDKTVLDALVPSLDAAESALAGDGSRALAAAVAAARDGVESSAGLVSRRGRAAWIGERGQGSRDAGAVAWLRLLEAMAGARAG